MTTYMLMVFIIVVVIIIYITLYLFYIKFICIIKIEKMDVHLWLADFEGKKISIV